MRRGARQPGCGVQAESTACTCCPWWWTAAARSPSCSTRARSFR